jgi:hypothetical protein
VTKPRPNRVQLIVCLALVAIGVAAAPVWARAKATPTSVRAAAQLTANAKAGGSTSAARARHVRLNCFKHLAKCGYPHPSSTGVPAGTKLKDTGSITVRKAGTVIKNKRVHGYILVQARNVTIKNTLVTQTTANGGQQNFGDGEPWAIHIEAGATGAVVEHSTMRGASASANAVLYGILNSAGTSTLAIRDKFYNCAQCYAGPGTLKNSYALDNGAYPIAHLETVYYGGGQGFLRILHDTLLAPFDKDADGNSHPSTAVVYTYHDFGVVKNLTINNSMLVGGGSTVYGGGGTAVGVRVTNNRFSRHYFPQGGFYGVSLYLPTGITWTGNIWDNSGARVVPSADNGGT